MIINIMIITEKHAKETESKGRYSFSMVQTFIAEIPEAHLLETNYMCLRIISILGTEVMFQEPTNSLTCKRTQLQGKFEQKIKTGPVPEFCNILPQKQPP
jgi:hypothetical protein